MTSFRDRIIRAVKLDAQLYEEVEPDTGAMGHAMGVVVLSSMAAGVGSVAIGGLGGILVGAIAALTGGMSGPILLTLLARNSFQSHRPKQISANYCALLDSRAPPA